MGVRIDQGLNDANANDIHASASAIRVLVVRADEEAMIAKHVRALLFV